MPSKGAPPTIETSNAIVQEAIFQAGGFEGPHPDTRTLQKAGLNTDKKRDAFQPAVDIACRDRHYIMQDVAGIPNDAGTTVSTVKSHVQQHAHFEPGKEK
ncbi:MAG TPA: hypothetical protein VFA76_04730 [Terriglobales bacterium]|nr:hypothetical protein [Terriglobales bacterium]